MKVIWENCQIESWDRFSDPGDYPSGAGGGPLPDGPAYPEEVSGFAIIQLEEEDKKTLQELVDQANCDGLALEDVLKEDDWYSELIAEALSFGGNDSHSVRTTKAKMVQLVDDFYVLIPEEAIWDHDEVGIGNASDEKIIAEAKGILEKKNGKA